MRFSMIPDLNIALRIVRWMQKDGLWDMVHDDENWSNVKLKYVEVKGKLLFKLTIGIQICHLLGVQKGWKVSL